MAMKIRLTRGGSKKRPFYRIVAADSRMPRDGRYIEKLGTYNPLLAKDSEERVKMNVERVQYWLGEGAQPTDRIARMLEAAGVMPKKERANLKKGEPGKKAKERVEEKSSQSSGSRRSRRRPSRRSHSRIICPTSQKNTPAPTHHRGGFFCATETANDGSPRYFAMLRDARTSAIKKEPKTVHNCFGFERSFW